MVFRGISGFLLMVCLLAAADLRAQEIRWWERDLAQAMLENAASDVRDHYFDPNLSGLTWDRLVEQAKGNIAQAPGMDAANAQIAGLLEDLNNSHTRFLPPRNLMSVDYGWKFQIIGDCAFITEVTPGSDAEAQGVHRGFQLLTINGFKVDRASAHKLEYAMDVIAPRSSVDVDLVDLDGNVLHKTLSGKIKKEMAVAGLGDPEAIFSNQDTIEIENSWRNSKAQAMELGRNLMVLRIPAFVQLGVDVDWIFRRARDYKSLIIDLRGTPGGRLDSVESYLANVFDHEVNLGVSIGRKKTTPLVAKGRRGAYGGDLIVLIDSDSASGAEIFARAVQLEQRGTVVGDHSAGSVMAARFFRHSYGENPVYYYSTEVTVADTRMADGKSLEGVGVEPDRKFLPTAKDLDAGRDSVLAYAAGLEGVDLSPENAAKLFSRVQPVH